MFIQDICKQKDGKLVYSWKNPGEAFFRDKTVWFNYIPEYDWIVVCSSYLDEIYAPLTAIRNIIILTVCLILALVFITSLWINHAVIQPLWHLRDQFSLGASGDMSIRMPVISKDEIGQLGIFFNKFMETLEIYHADLASEIKKHKQLERQVLNISEQERQKIAMELHDDLCPQLIGIEVMAKILAKKLEDQCIDETADVNRIRQLILDTITKTRHLSKGLSPVNLSDHGFDVSLKELAEHVKQVFNIDCRLNCSTGQFIKDKSMATHIYYIAHEAVHNAARHSNAKHISIDLTYSRQKIRLKISDNGKGMDNMEHSRGMGLKIMTYRAQRIGAALDITPNPHGGTLVQLDIEI